MQEPEPEPAPERERELTELQPEPEPEPTQQPTAEEGIPHERSSLQRLWPATLPASRVKTSEGVPMTSRSQTDGRSRQSLDEIVSESRENVLQAAREGSLLLGCDDE